MTQVDEGAFAGMESDAATKEVVQLLNEGVEGVRRGDMVGRWIGEGFIPRTIHETTHKEDLVMVVGIGIHVGSQILNEA